MDESNEGLFLKDFIFFIIPDFKLFFCSAGGLTRSTSMLGALSVSTSA
jgi:hypothetical protein